MTSVHISGWLRYLFARLEPFEIEIALVLFGIVAGEENIASAPC